MLSPIRTVAPAAPILTLGEAKTHLRVDHADEDATITALVQAAESYLDGWTGILGRALVTQTWRQDYADWSDVMILPLAPVQAITSIQYVDVAGAVQTATAGDFDLVQTHSGAAVMPKLATVLPALGDAPNPVRITFVAGYGVASAVPQAIRQAALLMVGDWYEARQVAVVGATASSVPMAAAVDALLAPFRRVFT